MNHVGTEQEDVPSKDFAVAPRGLGGRVKVAERGYTDGLQTDANVSILSEIRIFVSPTENLRITKMYHTNMYHTKKTINQTIDGNRGHFKNEIELTGVVGLEDKPRMNCLDFLVDDILLAASQWPQTSLFELMN